MSMICPVYADTGPKPSVNLTISGIKNKTYYVTLLSKVKSYGPYSSIDNINDYKNDDDFEIIKKFYNYKDNYYFLNYFDDCSEDNQFSWSYYPPEDFKILIYIKDDNKFICSDTLSKYAFNSNYNIKISNNDINVSKANSTNFNIKGFALRLVITILVELFIAYLFKFKEWKIIVIIIITNIITQLGLNIALNYLNNLFLLEFIITIIESFIYKNTFNKDNKKVIIYGISANYVSYIIGLIFNL